MCGQHPNTTIPCPIIQQLPKLFVLHEFGLNYQVKLFSYGIEPVWSQALASNEFSLLGQFRIS